ncbi:protein nifT [Klebsiella michiganensis]|uniref:Protein nifT n=1 Tax=Klebsiella michiganensis TaxID=1134687 RepID=A0A7H4MVN4_9ENTR|nr:protein nifT [Klebsiella michiganensis]
MPIVIFRERGADLYAYIAKQDLEARVLQIEHNDAERWGGAISLEGDAATTSIRSRGAPPFR